MNLSLSPGASLAEPAAAHTARHWASEISDNRGQALNLTLAYMKGQDLHDHAAVRTCMPIFSICSRLLADQLALLLCDH